MASSSASHVEASAQKKVTDEMIKQYMQSREVFKHCNTSVVVDGFRYTALYYAMRRRELDSSNSDAEQVAATVASVFFLTHFHSDHYTGLHAGWKHGTIFTGRTTGALLVRHLGVASDRVVMLEQDTPYIISLSQQSLVAQKNALQLGTSSTISDFLQVEPENNRELLDDELEVTLLNANHCPGAHMLLLRHKNFGTILHTGDFRYNGRRQTYIDRRKLLPPIPPPLGSFIGDDPILRSTAGKVDVLFLDNTFCDPAFQFSPQDAAFDTAINFVKDVARRQVVRKYHERSVVVTDGDSHFTSVHGHAEEVRLCSCGTDSAKCIHIAVCVGTYTIGKEKIALALSEVFRSRSGSSLPVFVSEQKKALLDDCIELPSLPFVPIPAHAQQAASALSSEVAAVNSNPRPAQFYETDVDWTVVDDSGAQRLVSRELFLSQDGDEEGRRVRFLVTIFLVPLQVLSYMHIAGSLDDAVCKDRHLPPRSLFLWEGCYLPLDGFDGVACIEPTGWAAGKSAKALQPKVIGRGKFELLSIPYSEHCSFSEMIEFVEFIQPKKIVPTVSVEQFTKQEPLFVERNPRMRTVFAAAQPLTRFAHLFRKPSYVGEMIDSAIQKVSGGKLSLPQFSQPRAKQADVANADAKPTSHTQPSQNNTSCSLSSLHKRPRDESRSSLRQPPVMPNTFVVSDDEDDAVTFVSSTPVTILVIDD